MTTHLKRSFLFGAFCCLSIALFSQNNNGANNYYYKGDSASLKNESEKSPFILKTNPFAILMAPIPVAAEYRICGEFSTRSKQSFQFGLSYLGKGPLIHLFDYNRYQTNAPSISKQLQLYGGRLQLSYKYYFLPQYKGINGELLPYGLYIAPHFSYAYAELHSKQNKDAYITFQNSNIVAMLGYNWDTGVKINIDFFTGMGYKWNIWREIDNANNATYRFSRYNLGIYGIPIKFYLGFNIGYAF